MTRGGKDFPLEKIFIAAGSPKHAPNQRSRKIYLNVQIPFHLCSCHGSSQLPFAFMMSAHTISICRVEPATTILIKPKDVWV